MDLYKHQKDLLELDPHKRLIAFGCGAGKTRAVLSLIEGKTLVIAPKTQVLDKTWERECKKMGIKPKLTVISKEQFKKMWANKGRTFLDTDTLIVDESHFAMGVLPATKQKKGVKLPKTSQIYESLLEFIKEVKPKRLYFASATPLPQPMALYALATLFGEKWDYFKFRSTFYVQVPRLGWDVWLPKKDDASKDRLLKTAKKFGSFGRLEDFFDVPDQVHKEIFVGETPAQTKKMKDLRLFYPDALSLLGKTHQLEQGIFEGEFVDENKYREIEELADEFPKLLVFARYTAQIDHLAEKLKKTFKYKDILVLDGRTIDRRSLLQQAEDPTKQTIVIAQSQVSTGYELPSFRCTIFASQSYSFVDYEQALGRTQRANHISKNVYVYLLSGKVDKAVLKCVKLKKDFNERLFIEEQDV